METFTPEQLNTAFENSGAKENAFGQSSIYHLKPEHAKHDAMAGTIASYNWQLPTSHQESAAACAVGCVVGFCNLSDSYDAISASKILAFTKRARCVGWAQR